MSKVTSYYHIVFCTKRREMTIPVEKQDDLYRFIWHQVKKLNCDLLRIGGIPNHVHMLINLHPSVALSTLMQNVKGRSSSWMGTNPEFHIFNGWASEYYACSVSPEHKATVIEYIKGQVAHHTACDFSSELVKMYQYADLIYDERDMM